MKLLAGTSNRTLAKRILAYLKGIDDPAVTAEYASLELTDPGIAQFSDNEIFVRIKDNVRGEDVYFIQSTSHPANDNIMELLICLDALRRASAQRVTVVTPYFGYARQDRKDRGRTPITAKLVANLVAAAGADRAIALDLHATQIQGFFDIPTDNLYAETIMAEDIQRRFGSRPIVVVSPDVGGVMRARALSGRLERTMGIEARLAIVDKYRAAANVAEVMNVIGDVAGCDCLLVDDMVDTGGTICKAAKALIDRGATSVSAYASHGVLSGEAVSKIAASHLDALVITDSIEQPAAVRACPKIQEISVAPLIGEAIYRIANNMSISELFD